MDLRSLGSRDETFRREKEIKIAQESRYNARYVRRSVCIFNFEPIIVFSH